MNYSLIIRKNNSIFEVVGFSQIPGYNNLQEHNLKDIVAFTSSFENKNELIEFLLNFSLIPKNYSDGNIEITYKKTGTYKRGKDLPKILPFGISYSDEKDFFDINYLVKYYIEKTKDINFFKEFVNRYSKLENVTIFANLINYFKCVLIEYEMTGKITKFLTNNIVRFIELYTHRKKDTGEYTLDFPRLRDLAMFAINYERNNYEEKEVNISTNSLKQELKHYKSLIDDGNISEEEYDMYIAKITDINEELEFRQKYLTRRRNINEITKD